MSKKNSPKTKGKAEQPGTGSGSQEPLVDFTKGELEELEIENLEELVREATANRSYVRITMLPILKDRLPKEGTK